MSPLGRQVTSHAATPAYRREADTWLIELKLREVRQLFNHLDPAPFRDKDLDAAAENYIEDAVREIGHHRPMKMVIYLPPAEMQTEAARTVPTAVSNYFSYRARQTRTDLRRLLRRGGINLVIALAFLALCLTLRQVLSALPGFEVLPEGLLIIGWVGLWRPVEIFLYDWWPIRQQLLRFEAISAMPVTLAASN